MIIERHQHFVDYARANALRANERIVWTGRPNPLRSAVIGLVSTVAAAILGTAFAVLWIGQILGSADLKDLSDLLWRSLLSLLGVAVFGTSVWGLMEPARRYVRALQTFYIITDSRILIIRKRRKYSIISIAAAAITDFERIDKQNDTGTIRLRKTAKPDGEGGTYESTEFEDGLWGIRGIGKAADAIGALQPKANRESERQASAAEPPLNVGTANKPEFRHIEDYKGVSIFVRTSDNRFCLGEDKNGSFLTRGQARNFVDVQSTQNNSVALNDLPQETQ